MQLPQIARAPSHPPLDLVLPLLDHRLVAVHRCLRCVCCALSRMPASAGCRCCAAGAHSDLLAAVAGILPAPQERGALCNGSHHLSMHTTCHHHNLQQLVPSSILKIGPRQCEGVYSLPMVCSCATSVAIRSMRASPRMSRRRSGPLQMGHSCLFFSRSVKQLLRRLGRHLTACVPQLKLCTACVEAVQYWSVQRKLTPHEQR